MLEIITIEIKYKKFLKNNMNYEDPRKIKIRKFRSIYKDKK